MNSEDLFEVAMAYCKANKFVLDRVELRSPRTAFLYILRGSEDLSLLRVWPSTLTKMREEYL